MVLVHVSVPLRQRFEYHPHTLKKEGSPHGVFYESQVVQRDPGVWREFGEKIVKIQVFSESNRLHVHIFWDLVITVRYVL